MFAFPRYALLATRGASTATGYLMEFTAGSGPVGRAFTLTFTPTPLNVGSVWPADTITLSFSLAVTLGAIANGTLSGDTITLNQNASDVTLVVTPEAAGTLIISATNSGDMSKAADLEYTVTSAFVLDGIATQPLVAMGFKKPTSSYSGGNAIGVSFSFNSGGGVGYDADGNFDVAAGAANTGNATMTGFINLGSYSNGAFVSAGSPGPLVFAGADAEALDGAGTASLAGCLGNNTNSGAGTLHSVPLSSASWMATAVTNITNATQGFGYLVILGNPSGGSFAGIMLNGSNQIVGYMGGTTLVGPTVVVGKRYVVTLECDGANLNLYVNGALSASAAVTASVISSSDVQFAGNYWPGVIPFAAVWNIAESASRVDATAISSWEIT